MSVPPPGWHPDAKLSAEPQPAEAVAGPAAMPTQSPHPVVGPAAVPTQFTAYDAPTAATALNQVASAPAPTLTAPRQRTLAQRNSTTLTAIVVVALYLVLAATTGIVLIGIFPAMLAVRAVQRREPLAAIAVSAAAVAIVFSITVLTQH